MRKKLTSLLLALVLTASLCACSSPEQTPPTALQVGYSKVDITPEIGCNISGYGDDEVRLAKSIKEKIYATCIAVTYQQESVLLYTVDNICLGAIYAESLRPMISVRAGVPVGNIFFGATHAHNCPTINDNYKPQLTDALVRAGEAAMADRSTATMLAAKPEFPGMNFVRHYEMSNGTYYGSNFGVFKEELVVGHATETDPSGVLIKFDREFKKKDILLVNWQAHPDSANKLGYYSISPSWVGTLRDTAERLSGMHVAYFTGASGNQNIDSMIPAERHNLSWRRYGTKMGQLIYRALEQLQPVEVTGIKTQTFVFDAEIDHSWDPMLEQANEVYDTWKTVGKKEGDELGATYGFTSSYQARAIRNRASLGKTRPLQMGVLCIGEIGFISASYEMFSDQGLYIKENSPFDTTFVITGNNGYLPSEEAYDYRSYEADTGLFVKGTAEKLAEKYVQLLQQIK